MPTYVYRREDGTVFEVFQRITDDALTTDPETGQSVERVISGGVGLQFKGSGFYLTDYARKSGGSEKGQESSPSSEGGSKADSSSESAPTSTKASSPSAESSSD